jgi:hypothetical protein
LGIYQFEALFFTEEMAEKTLSMLMCLLNFKQKSIWQHDKVINANATVLSRVSLFLIKLNGMKLQITFHVPCIPYTFWKKQQFKPPSL